MVLQRYRMTILFFSSFLFLSLATQAKIIHVPSDAASVKEAVEMAVSGDEILINSDTVSWISKPGEGGIVIKGKNLVITGNSSSSHTLIHPVQIFYYPDYTKAFQVEPNFSLLWIENSQITLRNLKTTIPPDAGTHSSAYTISKTAPIRLLSGSLTLENCVLNGSIETHGSLALRNSTLLADNNYKSFPYHTHDTFEYALTVSSATDIAVEMDHAVIDALDQKTNEGGTSSTGYLSALFQNLNNSRITMKNSQILGGYFSNDYRSPSYNSGSHGLSIVNCRNLTMELNSSSISGGAGNSLGMRTLNLDPPGSALPGGDGAFIQDSTLTLIGGVFVGGKGGSGNERIPEAYKEAITPGQGGNGLSLIRSTAFYQNLHLQEGTGGILERNGSPTLEIGGKAGLPLFMDEVSVFQEITSLAEWYVY